MAEKWKEFENKCYLYLKNQYGKYADFTALGYSDSTVSDILVELSNGISFYIETKSPSAQCGQFVLLANEYSQKFDYSSRNSTPFLPATKVIIDYMNDKFDDFVSAGTKGIYIDLNSDIFYSWIKDYYSSKNVRYFITQGNDYLIFPIEHFDNYFDVRAKYRIKKSGSSVPVKSNIAEIETILHKHDINGTIFNIGKQMYLETDTNIDGQKLTGTKYTYLFKKGEKSNFLIRKLSNTNNANVIFEINLKKYVQNTKDINDFLNSII